MLKKIIERAIEFGFQDVEIVENTNEEVSISLFQGNVDKNFNGSKKEYTLKGLLNGQMAITHFQKNEGDLTPKEIDNLIKKLYDNVKVLSSKEPNFIYEGSKKYPTIKKVESDISSISPKQKIKLLQQIEKNCFAKDERIELVPNLEYLEERRSCRIVNSKGLDVSKSVEFCGAYVMTVAGANKQDPNKQIGYEISVKMNFNEVNAKEIANKATKKALSMIGAAPVESGVYPVIIEKDAMRGLLSGFFSMFAGEAVLKHLSALEGKIGEKIMSDKVSIIDDPLNENSILKEPFDAEGVATFTKDVVKDGVLKTYLHNLKTAKAFGVEPTGNASTGGVAPMNFYLKGGELDLKQMMKKMKRGLVITSMQGLHAGLNPISGDFSAQSSGYLVENGKISRPVTLIVVSGNFLKMMNEIEEIGSDLEFGFQGFGSPSVWFTGLPVSGK